MEQEESKQAPAVVLDDEDEDDEEAQDEVNPELDHIGIINMLEAQTDDSGNVVRRSSRLSVNRKLTTRNF